MVAFHINTSAALGRMGFWFNHNDGTFYREAFRATIIVYAEEQFGYVVFGDDGYNYADETFETEDELLAAVKEAIKKF